MKDDPMRALARLASYDFVRWSRAFGPWPERPTESARSPASSVAHPDDRGGWGVQGERLPPQKVVHRHPA
jgi:hypothetical protein